jgi:hypothetical protein
MVDPSEQALQALRAYLPQDRLQALRDGAALPEATHGTALFADSSGFTPLIEQLTRQPGERPGLEELARRIDSVYAARTPPNLGSSTAFPNKLN